ncbi:MAG: leucine-rich repeat protein [bacterium]
MNFTSEINTLLTGTEIVDITNSKSITNALIKQIVTEEDLIQFSQFKYLLELGVENFVSKIYQGTKDGSLNERVEQVISIFDNNQVSPQIYSYYLYATLQAFGVKSDRVNWVDPFINNLQNVSFGFNTTFGSGLFVESIEDYEITKGTLKKVLKSKKYTTIPYGVKEINEMILSGNTDVEFVTLPESLSALPSGLLGNCNRLKTLILPSTIKVIPQNFCKGDKSLTLVVASGATKVDANAFEDTAINNVNFIGNNRIEIIGENSFKNCNNLKKVDLSHSKVIEKLAFNNCKAITDISIAITEELIRVNPRFHTIFENDIVDFKRYSELVNVTIHVQNGKIPNGYFEGCSNLSTIKVVGSVNSIGAKAFKGCTNLTSIDMKFTGNVIENETFLGCSKIASLPFFDNVTEINNSAFKECHALNNLKFKTIRNLGERVFEDCTHLSSIEFVYINKTLPTFTFSGCYSLRNYKFLENVEELAAYSLAKVIFDESFEIPSNIKAIATNAFDSCAFEKQLVVPSDCKINICAFSNINQISNVIYESLDIYDMNNQKIQPFMIFEHRLDAFNTNLKSLTDVQVNDHKVPEGAFKGWANINNVILYSDLHEIPNHCFEDCINLKTVYVESEEFSIGDRAFANCVEFKHLEATQSTVDFQNLHTVDLSLTTGIGEEAFKSCVNIERICVPIRKTSAKDQFRLYSLFEKEIIGMTANKYTNLHTAMLYLETGIVPSNLFEGCEKLKIIEVYGDVTELGEGFFKNCVNLVKIKMNYTGTVIPKECYKNCVSLTELSQYQSVTKIEAEAFMGCESLNKVEFLSPISSIGASTFESCTKLKQVKMDLQAEVLPKNCFRNCISIENFNFLHNIVKAESYCLANVVFPSGFIVPAKLDYIEKYAFANTTFVTTLSLPAAKYMDQLSFANAKGFTKVEFRNLKIIDTHNEQIKPFTIFTDSLQDFNFKYSGIDTVFVRTNNISDEAFKDWKFIRSVVATPEVTILPNSCFEGCTHLQMVKLPYGDMSLGSYVFKDCIALTTTSTSELLVTSKNKLIPTEVYKNCVNLTGVSIVIDSISIENGMKFYSFFEDNIDTFNEKYKKVTSVTLRSKTNKIPASFFDGCVNIEKIHIIDDIRSVDTKTFANCINLHELRMNYTGNTLPDECFLGCERLPNITNLIEVKTIGKSVFEKCYSLTALQFRSPIESIGEKAFAQCLNLEKINMYFVGEKVPDLCFAQCEGLLITPIFVNVRDVNASAFTGCINLDHVIINAVPNMTFNQIFPSSKRINKISYTSTIVPKRYFDGVPNVEEVEFTQKVTSIGEYAFANIPSLKTVKNLGSVETIASYAFANSGLEYIRISPKTMFIGAGIFAGCERLREIELPVRFEYAGFLFDDMHDTLPKKIIQKQHDVEKEYSIPETLRNITINDGVLTPGVFSGMQLNVIVEYIIKDIPDFAFFDCNTILLENAKAVETIGQYAFAYSTIKDAILTGVSTVDKYAFYNSNINVLEFGRNLKDITNESLMESNIKRFKLTANPNFTFINEMLVNLEKGMIIHTNNLSGAIVVPDAVTKLEENTFVNCENVTQINTNRVNTIKTGAFVNCNNLSSIILDKNLVTCEEAIFRNCNNINQLTLNFLGKDRRTPKEIGYLFQNMSEEVYMKKIEITGGQLVEEPFVNCAVIEELDISKVGLSTLNAGIFKNIIFNKLTLPDTLDNVDEFAFENSIATEVVSNGKSIKVKDQCIFKGQQLIYCHIDNALDITIPQNINEIVATAFNNTNSIQNITILNDSIKLNNAFAGISSVTGVVIGDLPQNISQIFASAIDTIKNVTFTGRKIRQGFFDTLLYFNELNLPNVEKILLEDANMNPDTQILIENLNIGSNLTRLDLEILNYIDVLNINIENNKRYKTYNNILVDTNEDAIVYVARELESQITIDFDVKEIKDGVFSKNDNLVSINTGNIKVIGDDAFRGCRALRDITITDKCNKIGLHILKHCDKLRNIVIPYIGETSQKTSKINYLFDNAHPDLIVQSITITNQKIIDGTFENSKNFQKIILAEGTKEIKAKSFSGASNLKDIFIPKSLNVVGESIFLKCKKKLNVYVENKSQVDAWSKDWRKTKSVQIFNNIKVNSLKERRR